jgi:DNA polymerase
MKISYMGDYRRTPAAPPIWGKVFTYGGKLVENFTQAFARDVMAYSMPAAEEAGYAITLTIHDEMVTESDGGTAEELSAIMATVPPWAKGLPLAAAGFVADRYKKD